MNADILFICTGNYYRSRFAEILFNHISNKEGLELTAHSRGLRISAANKGPLSPHTIQYMEELQLNIEHYKRYPQAISTEEFYQYPIVIAMDREEHFPMMKELYPDLAETISYWSFADDYITDPSVVLPELEKKISAFVEELKLK